MKKHVWIVLVLAFFISIAMAGGATPSYADSSGAAVIASGECGPNATYTLDADGVFTISGTGETYDYAPGYYYGRPEWYDIRSSIKTVVIENGITDIGEELFYESQNLTSVTIAPSVTSISDDAFVYCYNLEEITFLNAGFDSTSLVQYMDETFGISFAIKAPSCAFASTPSYTYNGTAKTPEVIAYDVDGNVLDADYSVSYENNINAGTARALVTFYGKYAGTQTLEYTIKPKAFTGTCSLSKTSYLYNGESKKPTVTVKTSSGTKLTTKDYSVKYSNNIKPGTAKATITFKGNYSGTKTLTYTIKKSTPKTVTLSKTSYIYNGKLKKPTVTVKTSTGKVVKKSNYTVTYSNNKNAGTAKVTVKFKGDYYTGTRTKTFKIKPRTLTKSKVQYGAFGYTITPYNGKTQWPLVQWYNTTDPDNPKLVNLKRGTDYTAVISGKHSKVGTYPVTLKFKGNYTGTVKTKLEIVPAIPKITSLSATPSGITVKWKKQSQVSGYIINVYTTHRGQTVMPNKTYKVKGASATSKVLPIRLSYKETAYISLSSYKTVKGKTHHSLDVDQGITAVPAYYYY